MAADPAGKNFGLTVGQSVTTRMGGKWTPEKAKFFNAWARAEGTQARYNPFATTRKGYPGEESFNSVGVKNYPSLAVGIEASYDTLQNGYYDHIVELLRSDNATAEDLAKAVANSPWGTGTGVLRVLGAGDDAFDGAVSAKVTSGLQSAQDAATYGTLRGETEAMHRSIALQPTLSYTQFLRSRGSFGARLADIAERGLEYTPNTPEETATPSTPSATAGKSAPQFTPAGDDDLGLSVGGAKYNLLDSPEGHGKRPLGNWQSDNAYDLGVPLGTPVYAVRDGDVQSNFGVQSSRPDDGARLEAGGVWYGHLSRIVVKPGDKIKRGQLLGYSGASQNGVAHLHIGFKPQGA